MPNNSSSDKNYKVFGDNSLIRIVNETLFVNGYFAGSIFQNPLNNHIKFRLFFELEDKYHNTLLQNLPLENIKIETSNYHIIFEAEFENIPKVEDFFIKLCHSYECCFDIVVEKVNELECVQEGTATIGNHQWRIHKSDADDIWPFPIHAHCHCEVLDPFTGNVYICHDRSRVIRKVSKRNLRLIQEKIRKNKDYGELFDQYLQSYLHDS